MRMNKMASQREFLEALPTSSLDEMLQNELQKETVDADLVRLILCVLEEREAGYPLETNDEISAALEDFEKSLDKRPGRPAKTKVSWILKAASILLVIGLLLFVVPHAVNAESFFEMLARWTDSIFEFFNPSENRPDTQMEYVFKTDNHDLQQIHGEIKELGIQIPAVPMWIPDGYKLKNMEVLDQSLDVTISAEFVSTDSYLIITIIMHGEEVPYKHEKNKLNVTVVELGGVDHYIVSNKEERIVTWLNSGVECVLVTNCQEGDLYNILESVYLLEG